MCQWVYSEYSKKPQLKEALGNVNVTKITVPKGDYGNNVEVPMYVHTPTSLENTSSHVAIIHCHGGGAIGGSIDDDKFVAAYIAKACHAIVVDVAYQLAPEGTAEGMAAEIYSAIRYVHDNATTMKIDSQKIVLHGGSGGGLAVLATCGYLASRDQSGLIALAIPCQSIILSFYITEKRGINMTKQEAASFYEGPFLVENLCGSDHIKHFEARHPVMFPTISEDSILMRWPPCILLASEFDNYRKQMRRFSERLKKCGKLLEYICYPGVNHGFMLDWNYKVTSHYWDDLKTLINSYVA